MDTQYCKKLNAETSDYSYSFPVERSDVLTEMGKLLSENKKYYRISRNAARYKRVQKRRPWDFDDTSHELRNRYYELDCQAQRIRTETYHIAEKAIQRRRCIEMTAEGKISSIPVPFPVAYTHDDKRLLACSLVTIANIAGVKYAVRVIGNKAFTVRGDAAPVHYKKNELTGMEFTINIERLAKI
jgi:hypothetical protein